MTNYQPKQQSTESFWEQIGINDVDLSSEVHQGFEVGVYYHLLARIALSQIEFGCITAIPVTTLRRRLKNHARFSTRQSDSIYRLVTLIIEAADLFNGDEQQAIIWMKTMVYGLNNQRPIDMITTTIGHHTVLDLVGRIKYGVIS
jgi:putative toxin-antitoxin system antitoxin component (TIGR02293 family)